MEGSYVACGGKGTEYAPDRTGSLGQGLARRSSAPFPVRQKRVELCLSLRACNLSILGKIYVCRKTVINRHMTRCGML